MLAVRVFWRRNALFRTDVASICPSSLAALLGFLMQVNASAATLLSVGLLPGGSHSEATAISPDGKIVVGGASSSAFPGGEAFMWTAASGIVALGDLPGGRSNSLATAVAGNGNGIVGYGLSTNTLNQTEAFSWSAENGMTRLSEILPEGTINLSAQGVSADGQVVVGVIDVPNRREAFRWSNSSGLVGLGDFDGGTFSSTAYAVSADGSVIVGDGRSAIGIEAFRWTQESGLISLGHLSGASVSSSTAFDVSADGNTVVGYSTSTNGLEAFLWTSENGLIGLGYITPADEDSVAQAVSADGKTVVGYASGENGRSAFVWSSSQGMRSLWQILLSQGIDPAESGWTSLSVASDVSADGRFVVGRGQRNGQDEAFIADLAASLTIQKDGGEIRLTWPAEFRLQRSTAFESNAWQDVPAASPPFTVTPGGGLEFFRVVAIP